MNVVNIISSNILCPLGISTPEVVGAVLHGRSGLARHNDYLDCEPYFASKLDLSTIDLACIENKNAFSTFEKMAIFSIHNANSQNIDFSDDTTIFILSTTKGNIDLLESENLHYEDLMLWASAKKIAEYFGNNNRPIVVSNACISGGSALIVAKRYLTQGIFKTAVVVGCDLVSRFVVSGFQSFKALSQNPCRPFDKKREGLNLGEAAATAILQLKHTDELASGAIYLGDAAITNDATHISAPSRTAEGLIRAIHLCDTSGIGFVAAHGTATAYNDAMEAKAIAQTGFSHLPTFSLKGYFGHTLGTAGLLETLVCCELLQQNFIVKNLHLNECDSDCNISISQKTEPYEAQAFLKTISGFGGCNAALVVRKLQG